MEQLGTYYFARLHKSGQLNDESLGDVLASTHSIGVGDKKWMFTSFEKGDSLEFYFARLCKFAPTSIVPKIDPEAGIEYEASETDIRIASSPFVYLPSYSCIAFLEVPGQITLGTFKMRFSSLVERYFDDVFVECDLEFIADLVTFFHKVRELDTIKLIEANVHPSNPRFQPFWKSLDEYLRNRKAAKLRVSEQSKKDGGLESKLKNIDENKLAQMVTSNELNITDAALVMAADGYGDGKVKGTSKGRQRTVSTSQTVANFDSSKNPEPLELAEQTSGIMAKRDKNMG